MCVYIYIKVKNNIRNFRNNQTVNTRVNPLQTTFLLI